MGAFNMCQVKCAMLENCNAEVTHIDKKGFVYCLEHGQRRKAYVSTRKLKASEIKLLKENKQIKEY